MGQTAPKKAPEQLARALAERAANDRAAARGEPLPYPNLWDTLDSTKVAPWALGEELARSYLAFRETCPPRLRKKHSL
jgi:hypothetical protein